MAKRNKQKWEKKNPFQGVKKNQRKLRYEQFSFDDLRVYLGYPYTIESEEGHNSITIYSPAFGDIIDYGYNKFLSAINPFIANTTQYRLPLWKSGKDWCEMSDFELFIMLIMARNIDNEALKFLFHDEIDWNKFEPSVDKSEEKERLLLYNEEADILITERFYQEMVQYIRYVLQITVKEDVTSSKILKKWYIQADEAKIKNAELRDKPKEEPSMLPLISSCLNHPGFKYDRDGLKKLTFFEFYDSVKRLQVYESSRACMTGMYSGMVDGKKIPKDSYNFMRPIE